MTTMFKAIIDPDRIKQCQKLLVQNIEKEFRNIGIRRVGFPGGHEDCIIFANDRIWFHSSYASDGTPRHWNAFGLAGELDKIPSTNLYIAVEINIPFEFDRRISGFFAMDDNFQDICLFHRGKIGGGRKGVGKRAFLEWYPKDIVDVYEDENTYEALFVTNLQSDSFVQELASFVELVAEFRNFVTGK